MTNTMCCLLCGKATNELYMFKCHDCFVLISQLHREGKKADCVRLIIKGDANE